MTFNLYGKNPKVEEGTYFKNTFWSWLPLWNYVSKVVGVLSDEQIRNGYRNDGFLIGSSQAKKIADKLKEELESGRTAQYAEDYKKEMEALPEGRCYTCYGDGLINNILETKMQTCHTCGGKKVSRPWATNYPFTMQNVREFQKFCEHCGGFSIW